MRLFSWFILRRMRREPLRSATTIAGVALGVAVIVAIQLTNASSFAGFETALNTISGRATLEIVGTGVGVTESAIAPLTWLRDYGQMAPVIEGDVVYRTSNGATTLRVLGVDMLRESAFRDYSLAESSALPDTEAAGRDLMTMLTEPGAVMVAEKFARAEGLTVGGIINVVAGDRAVPLTIRGLLREEGPARALDGHFLLLDIAAAQDLVGRPEHITRLDVRLDSSAAIDAAERAIAERLPPGLTVQRPAQRGRQVEQMLAAFHLNLTALSYVALLVGLFLVYNTISVAVLSRREEIGALRAIGVTRGAIRALFLGEALVLALAGCTVGLGLGRVLADGAVALTATTVTALYIAAAAAPPSLEWHHVLLAFGVGVPLSLLAALVPAQEAARVPPASALRDTDAAARRARVPWRSAAVAVVLLAAGAALSAAPPIHGLPLLGYASALTTVFGTACLVPLVLFVGARTALGPARRFLKVEDWLAVTNVASAIPRLSISVAALAVSLSMMVAIAIMIGSFRETVVYWVGQTLQADLFIGPGTRGPRGNTTLSDELVDLVRQDSQVVAVDRLRTTEVPYDGTVIRVGGSDFRVMLDHGNLMFKAPADARRAMRTSIGSDAVVVSESFALKHDADVGATITLPTAIGPHAFHIAAIYYDYSSDRGVVMMDRERFAPLYQDAGVNGISVYLSDGANAEQAADRLRASIGDRFHVLINTNRDLRGEVLRIFDSTFAITYALELVAIIVAVLGVAGTLVTLVLERERDLTILRLIGTGAASVRRMVVGEAMLIGLASQVVGLGMGFLLSLLIIFVINVQSFGWTIQFHLPIAFLAQASLALVGATGIAGLYPARRAAHLTLRRDE